MIGLIIYIYMSASRRHDSESEIWEITLLCIGVAAHVSHSHFYGGDVELRRCEDAWRDVLQDAWVRSRDLHRDLSRDLASGGTSICFIARSLLAAIPRLAVRPRLVPRRTRALGRQCS